VNTEVDLLLRLLSFRSTWNPGAFDELVLVCEKSIDRTSPGHRDHWNTGWALSPVAIGAWYFGPMSVWGTSL